MGLKKYTCQCKYVFIMGKKRVYGPISPMALPSHDFCWSNHARMMTIKQFDEQYSDCSRGTHRTGDGS